MSTITPAQPMVSPPPTWASLTPLRITVDEYERIIASGSLNEPSKVELIDGYMVTKMAKSAEHGFSTKEVLKALERLIPLGWTGRKEEPVRISPFDEPEPDITIVRGTDADYRHRIPEVSEVGLLLEVSRTNVSADRQQGIVFGARRRPRLLDRQPVRPPSRGLHRSWPNRICGLGRTFRPASRSLS